MKLVRVDIHNFRKLKCCRIEIGPKQTIFVGANNSGKTSAMDAMILFLRKDRRKDIATTDFTLSNWRHINEIGTQWVKEDDENPDLDEERWLPYLPSLDVWLDVNDRDLHHVIHLLPTLDWEPKQKMGVRLAFAPKDIKKLYREFREPFRSARKTEDAGQGRLTLWPKSLRDFLDMKLHAHFAVKAYILDPAQYAAACSSDLAIPQGSLTDSRPMGEEPFDGLIRINVIGAERGFSDSPSGLARLSTQLRDYFRKHLDPMEFPEASDIVALEAIDEARKIFDERLATSFRPALGELEGMNYPGFSDPKITLTSQVNAIDTLEHEAAVRFSPGDEADSAAELSLPEQCNGLGYRNLISMVFGLIRFRDEWIRAGKAARIQGDNDLVIEPLHLVLIEEPEAHLHAQIQQVFIRKAYDVLQAHAKLRKNENLKTQMVVSTHSSHIAHELDFPCLRYFKRQEAEQTTEIPLATVVDLSRVFGDEDKTSRFATRYIRSTHCDLFFADAVILVEGTAERILLPHFVRRDFPMLDRSYVSLLEIGGSHAHRLKPLLEILGLPTLIITDLDSVKKSGNRWTKTFPEFGKDYRTGNTTLKEWIPKMTKLDAVLRCSPADKVSEDKQTCVAYQSRFQPGGRFEKEAAIPYTFEDSLILSNAHLFTTSEDLTGLFKQLVEALTKDTLDEVNRAMYESVTAKSAKKAEMALDLLYLWDPDKLQPPTYIRDGLQWLQERVVQQKDGFATSAVEEVKDG